MKYLIFLIAMQALVYCIDTEAVEVILTTGVHVTHFDHSTYFDYTTEPVEKLTHS